MEEPNVGQNAMPHLPEVAEIYPTVPAGIPAAVGSDGRTSVEGVAGTITAPLPTPSTPMRAATVAMLDNYVQVWVTAEDSSDTNDHAADNLADCFNPGPL